MAWKQEVGVSHEIYFAENEVMRVWFLRVLVVCGYSAVV